MSRAPLLPLSVSPLSDTRNLRRHRVVPDLARLGKDIRPGVLSSCSFLYSFVSNDLPGEHDPSDRRSPLSGVDEGDRGPSTRGTSPSEDRLFDLVSSSVPTGATFFSGPVVTKVEEVGSRFDF